MRPQQADTLGEAIRPAVYVRRKGVLRETLLPPHPLRRYDSPEHQAELEDALRAISR